jgi:putative copper export protein
MPNLTQNPRIFTAVLMIVCATAILVALAGCGHGGGGGY